MKMFFVNSVLRDFFYDGDVLCKVFLFICSLKVNIFCVKILFHEVILYRWRYSLRKVSFVTSLVDMKKFFVKSILYYLLLWGRKCFFENFSLWLSCLDMKTIFEKSVLHWFLFWKWTKMQPSDLKMNMFSTKVVIHDFLPWMWRW